MQHNFTIYPNANGGKIRQGSNSIIKWSNLFRTSISVMDLKSRIISVCLLTKTQNWSKIVSLQITLCQEHTRVEKQANWKARFFFGKIKQRVFSLYGKNHKRNSAYQSQVSVKGVTVFCVCMYGADPVENRADFHCWMLFHDLYIQYIAKALRGERKFTRLFYSDVEIPA